MTVMLIQQVISGWGGGAIKAEGALVAWPASIYDEAGNALRSLERFRKLLGDPGLKIHCRPSVP